MKFALMGAPCAHKTTTWLQLWTALKTESWRQDYPELRIRTYDSVGLAEVAREIWESLNVPNFKTQWKILTRQIELEEAVKDAPIVLCDRTVLDQPVFMQFYPPPYMEWKAETQFIEDLARGYERLNPYDKIFYLESAPLVQDSKRKNTVLEQTRLDDLSRKYLELYCPEKVVWIKQTQTDRILPTILDMIDNANQT